MTQPTKEELIAARDAVIATKNEWIGQKQLCIYVGMSEIDTLLSLLDSHINPPDLSELRKTFDSAEYEDDTDYIQGLYQGIGKGLERRNRPPRPANCKGGVRCCASGADREYDTRR